MAFIGENLKKLRKNCAEMSQQAVAHKSDIAEITLGRYERSATTPPADSLASILEAIEANPVSVFPETHEFVLRDYAIAVRWLKDLEEMLGHDFETEKFIIYMGKLVRIINNKRLEGEDLSQENIIELFKQVS